MSRVIDLTGQTFGHWKVIGRDFSKRGGSAYWFCQCDCGTSPIRSIRGADLRNGKSKSCGCINIARCQATGEDLTGQQFGKLTVLRQGEKSIGNRHRHWICRCECGNITQPIPSDRLKNGNTTSCGCINSQGEFLIRTALQELQIPFEVEKNFESLKGDQKPLRFDFYLPNENICIEYQGIQHFEPRERFGGEEQFQIQKKYDALKKDFCQTNNISLIEISYKDKKKINTSFIKSLLDLTLNAKSAIINIESRKVGNDGKENK